MRYAADIDISEDFVMDEEDQKAASMLVAERDQPFIDLKKLRDTLRRASRASEILGYTVLNRGRREEAIDRPVSAAFYASLVSYHRDEKPQYHFNGCLIKDGKFPSRAPEIVSLLDEIRAELIRLLPDLKRTLRRGRQTVGFARAWTTLWLALDAVPRKDLPSIVMFSPVSHRSQDPQGDAQMAAEDHYAEEPKEIGDGGGDLDFDDFEEPIQTCLFDSA